MSNHETLGEIIIIFLFQAPQQCYQANINYSDRTGRGLLNNFADEISIPFSRVLIFSIYPVIEENPSYH